MQLPELGTREIDVVGTLGARLLAGEIKTSPDWLTDERLKADIELSQILGADVHLVATIGSIEDALRGRIEDMVADANLESLILDSADLRPS